MGEGASVLLKTELEKFKLDFLTDPFTLMQSNSILIMQTFPDLNPVYLSSCLLSIYSCSFQTNYGAFLLTEEELC